MADKKWIPYFEKLKDPRWQKVRLLILERARFACELCSDNKSTLHVHHGCYLRGLEPWEHHPNTLWCLCETCHDEVQDTMHDLHLELGRTPPSLLSACLHAILDVRKKDDEQWLEIEKWKDEWRAANP